MPIRESSITKDGSPGHVDLSALINDPPAAQILMLARGQLNRAFRTHGLASPDPLPVDDVSDVATGELDDPASLGVETATARFKSCFVTWSKRMPTCLVRPVLDILRQTYKALESDQDGTDSGAAVLNAYTFLLERAELS